MLSIEKDEGKLVRLSGSEADQSQADLDEVAALVGASTAGPSL